MLSAFARFARGRAAPPRLLSRAHGDGPALKVQPHALGGLHPWAEAEARALADVPASGGNDGADAACNGFFHAYPPRTVAWLLQQTRTLEHARRRCAAGGADDGDDAAAGDAAGADAAASWEFVLDPTDGENKWVDRSGGDNSGRAPLSISQLDLLDLGAGADGAFAAAARHVAASADDDDDDDDDAAAELRLAALEPDETARAALERALGDGGGGSEAAVVLGGDAAAIALPSGSVHAAFAANAFHWFATPRALFEISRVLRKRGYLGLLWQAPDGAAALWVRRLHNAVAAAVYSGGGGDGGEEAAGAELALVEPHGADAGRVLNPDWKGVFGNFLGCYYGPLHHRTERSTRLVGAGQLVAALAAQGGAAALPRGEREVLRRRLAEIVDEAVAAGEVETVGGAGGAAAEEGGERVLCVPHVCEAYWCQLIDKDY
jgi:SAM-dependent methyltransferase